MRGGWVARSLGSSSARSGTLNACSSRWAKSALFNSLSVFINDGLAVLFAKGSLLWSWKYFQYLFRRAAQTCAPWCDDNGPVDQNGMLQHEVNELFISPRRIA